MKTIQYKTSFIILKMLFSFSAIFLVTGLFAQDSTATSPTEDNTPVVKKKSFTKNTFEGKYIIDNQTVMVPIKGTLDFDIQHHFGTTDNGIKDLYGIFATAKMRLAFSYVPVKNLEIGFGANNYNMVVDGNLKYAILKQTTDNAMPVSVTYYGDIAMDTRAKNGITISTTNDRFSYFNQLLVARKITPKLSLQLGASITHRNNVEGYYDTDGSVQPQINNTQFAFSASGRYKVSPQSSIMVNYDQPLTQNAVINPRPNLSFGWETATSGHTFQVFMGNYGYTLPQYNIMLNQNNFKNGQWVIGFNISRLWNF
ncbi:MAG: DUF5777 family beta-barrel protein [Chitinophagaceae bacterium]|jgi:hypothetical protein|nr:DUF5777 family beta-barrel protein [Chitinophagaceae bacterium]